LRATSCQREKLSKDCRYFEATIRASPLGEPRRL
jgi:hypothetical protein